MIKTSMLNWIAREIEIACDKERKSGGNEEESHYDQKPNDKMAGEIISECPGMVGETEMDAGQPDKSNISEIQKFWKIRETEPSET